MFGLSDDKTAKIPADENFDSATDQAEPVTYSDSHPPAPAPDEPQGDSASFWSDSPASSDGDDDKPAPPPAQPNDDNDDSAPPPVAAGDSDLLSLKQNALQDLAPLVSHLDQTPEEKFKTTMMLIQASDNASLVKQAYEAAGQIQDEKARAQALLDVVNEINYFTHQQPEKS